jgi:iron complex outermembrane receptor protein
METVFTYRLKGDKDKPRKCVFQEFYIGIDTKKAAKVTDIVPPENPTDGYFLAELSAGCSAVVFGKEVSLSSRVKNLFNTVYFDHTSYYRLINVPGQGRCLTISLTVKL